jgi:Eukaryotic aspartyl protease
MGTLGPSSTGLVGVVVNLDCIEPSPFSNLPPFDRFEQVEGQHAMDILTLGSVSLEKQVFAQVTTLHNFTTCEAEEGVLGLAPASKTSHNFPSLIQNMIDTNHLQHSLYSVYFNPKDDYPRTNALYEDQDENGNIEYGYQKPTSASSQIIFGGVDQRHYEGCLQWHALGNVDDGETGDRFGGFWDLALQDVRVGGRSVSTSKLAFLDTGSSYIIGPPDSVGQIANLNHASCFNMTQPSKPQLVDCSNGFFDAAVVDCDQPLFNVEFVADGRVYVLEKEDMLIETETSLGRACVLRLVGSEGIPVSLEQE